MGSAIPFDPTCQLEEFAQRRVVVPQDLTIPFALKRPDNLPRDPGVIGGE